MSTEKYLTGYPSIDKPWLKHYTEEWTKDLIPKKTVYRNIYDNNIAYKNDIAIIFNGFKTSYGKMFEMIDKYAKALKANGIKKDDCVSMCMSYTPEAVCLVLACSKIGALANFINPLFTTEQKIARLNEAEAKVTIVLDALFPYMQDAVKTINTNKIVILPAISSLPMFVRKLVEMKSKKSTELVEFCVSDKRYCSWNSFVKSGCTYVGEIEVEYEENRPVVMVYSSGTTGASKGIVLTNDGVNAIFTHFQSKDFPHERGNTFLAMVPIWFSTGNVLSMLNPIAHGMTLILEPVFSVDSFVKDMVKYKPNMTVVATSQWLGLIKAKECENIDLSNMRYPITGGEKILKAQETAINDFFKAHNVAVPLMKGYGMCELGGSATVSSYKHSKLNGVGYPIKGVTVSAFDVDTNEERKYGERGEIRVSSPACMKGYFKNEQATDEYFYQDNNGNVWGCTGDIGYVDEDGEVFILGRATDCYYTNDGERVFQFDIEEVILQNDSVGDCKVVQTTDKNMVVAHIVLKDGCEQSERDIIINIHKNCVANLQECAIPTHYKIRDSFPVHSNGKRDIEALKNDTENLTQVRYYFESAEFNNRREEHHEKAKYY